MRDGHHFIAWSHQTPVKANETRKGPTVSLKGTHGVSILRYTSVKYALWNTLQFWVILSWNLLNGIYKSHHVLYVVTFDCIVLPQPNSTVSP